MQSLELLILSICINHAKSNRSDYSCTRLSLIFKASVSPGEFKLYPSCRNVLSIWGKAAKETSDSSVYYCFQRFLYALSSDLFLPSKSIRQIACKLLLCPLFISNETRVGRLFCGKKGSLVVCLNQTKTIVLKFFCENRGRYSFLFDWWFRTWGLGRSSKTLWDCYHDVPEWVNNFFREGSLMMPKLAYSISAARVLFVNALGDLSYSLIFLYDTRKCFEIARNWLRRLN